MTLFDISEGLLNAPVYPGDPEPKREVLSSLELGDDYTVSALSLCSHSATHIDAPSHAVAGGMTVDKIPLYMTVGLATVVECDGIVDEEKAKSIISSVFSCEFGRRILFKGDVEFTEEGATYLASVGVYLVGVSSMSVGTRAVHHAFLSGGTIILEGISLSGIEPGCYFLHAAPMFIEDADGAPCRAILHKI